MHLVDNQRFIDFGLSICWSKLMKIFYFFVNSRLPKLFSQNNVSGLITAHKRSLGQGNMFTGVCLSTGVPAPGGGAWSWGVSAPGGCLLLGGAWSQGVPAPGGVPARGGGGTWSQGVPGGDPLMATAAGGMHPTGMHSCLKSIHNDNQRYLL